MINGNVNGNVKCAHNSFVFLRYIKIELISSFLRFPLYSEQNTSFFLVLWFDIKQRHEGRLRGAFARTYTHTHTRWKYTYNSIHFMCHVQRLSDIEYVQTATDIFLDRYYRYYEILFIHGCMYLCMCFRVLSTDDVHCTILTSLTHWSHIFILIYVLWLLLLYYTWVLLH